jgi:hypothetical protein
MKFVCESLDDILKPKEANELLNIYKNIEKRYEQYLVKSNANYSVFIFDLNDNPDVIKDFNKLNIQHFTRTPFSQSLDKAEKYIMPYFKQYGPFIFILDKDKGEFYLTQHGIDFVTDSENHYQFKQVNGEPEKISSDEFLSKYL